jgi:hypothetical protein
MAVPAALLTTRQSDLPVPILKVLSWHVLMDKQGVGMDMWTSLQNAQLDHMSTPPTRTYPQRFRLWPDALRLPNSQK